MSELKRQFALEVVDRLQRAGHQALWAGGCVRDLVMGRPPDDFDVATSARPDQVQSIFRRTLAVGASFGVIIVLGGPGQGQVEVATFRTEGGYSDGRRPDQVEFSTAELDAKRRDFTINGMFFDPVRGEILDFVAGREDLERRVIRSIGDASERFSEDKLRLLRAVRFAARFGFELEPATEHVVRSMAADIKIISAERIAAELRRILVDPNRVAGISLCDRVGLLVHIMPEVVAMHEIPQGKPVQPHGDLWQHSLLVLEHIGPAWRTSCKNLGIGDAPAEPSFPLASAALLHDVGKPLAMARNGSKLTFYDHEHIGQRIAISICRRLKLSNDDRDRIAWLVERHMYLGEAKIMRLAKLKRALVEPGIEELLALHRADAMASSGKTDQVDYCEQLKQQLPEMELNPPPIITGHDLVRIGMEPGPTFKDILDKVREAQLEGTLKTKKDALAMAKRMAGME